MSRVPRRPDRGLAPVAGVLLLAIAVVLAGGVAAATLGAPPEPAPSAVLSLSATGDRIAVEHRGGDPIDVSSVTVRISVDGDPLARQPPLPFFSARGFHSGPTGAFNAAGDDVLRTGATATLRVADTNDPDLEPGRTVTVALASDGRPVARLEAVVEPG